MENKQIVCIFCGGYASRVVTGETVMVVCWQCKRKTEFKEYRRLVVKWLDDVGGMIRQDLPEA